MQKAENAYDLQIKAQSTAEQAIKHLQEYMAEQERLVRTKKQILF